ncbi:hypothetical protein DERF_010371 [Dermatophagoides farinae]|uniref:Uncharacterized protein n=1 Tax=Dermatophagoides farinae TaxID=6954 RepID=A0A922HVZ2_DERFA|nr:hypothetical protein DERF_010371 [Dermatophagoides farinae]
MKQWTITITNIDDDDDNNVEKNFKQFIHLFAITIMILEDMKNRQEIPGSKLFFVYECPFLYNIKNENKTKILKDKVWLIAINSIQLKG